MKIRPDPGSQLGEPGWALGIRGGTSWHLYLGSDAFVLAGKPFHCGRSGCFFRRLFLGTERLQPCRSVQASRWRGLKCRSQRRLGSYDKSHCCRLHVGPGRCMSLSTAHPGLVTKANEGMHLPGWWYRYLMTRHTLVKCRVQPPGQGTFHHSSSSARLTERSAYRPLASINAKGAAIIN
jgi:hypothetical protein